MKRQHTRNGRFALDWNTSETRDPDVDLSRPTGAARDGAAGAGSECPTSTEYPTSPTSRRRFARALLLSAPVLLTVAGRPVFAGGTGSAGLSGIGSPGDGGGGTDGAGGVGGDGDDPSAASQVKGGGCQAGPAGAGGYVLPLAIFSLAGVTRLRSWLERRHEPDKLDQQSESAQ